MLNTRNVTTDHTSNILLLLKACFTLGSLLITVLGIGLIALSAYLESPKSVSIVHLGAEILRDLGIAVLIAVIVALAIELYAGIRLRTHIAKDVLQAAFEKVIPPEIYSEVADNIFRTPVCRRRWEVNTTILSTKTHVAQYNDVRHHSDNIYIADSDIFYDIENLQAQDVDFLVSGGIDLDVPLPDLGYPRFEFISVDKHCDQKLNDDMEAKNLLLGRIETLDKGKLSIGILEGQLRFSVRAMLPAKSYTRVKYRVFRAIRAPGIYVLSASTPTDGATITIKSADLQFQVIPLHPVRGALQHPNQETWLFPRGILPWQGFVVRSYK